MKKRFYVVLFSALCLSALLLGFSYAKESGTNQEVHLNLKKDENFKVVLSDSELSTLDDNGTDISVVNRSNRESVVVLSLERQKKQEEKNDKKDKEKKKEPDVYYSINNGEIKKLTDNDIKLGILKSYGTEGDHQTYNIKLTSKSDEPIYYDIKITKEERRTISEIIIASEETYKDTNSIVRYYGANPANYMMHENKKYRIVSVMGDKLRLVTSITDESDYWTAKESGSLLPSQDYLCSFQTYCIGQEGTKEGTSWLKEQQYWLAEEEASGGYVASAKLGMYIDSANRSHNNRFIIEIPSNGFVINGDGTENNPYEVSYGS